MTLAKEGKLRDTKVLHRQVERMLEDPRGQQFFVKDFAATANGTNTSPVLRGIWVSERILGVPIPPPPESVPAVEPDIRGAKTIREQLQKHLSDDACAVCHRKIDPPGYALENLHGGAARRSRSSDRCFRRLTSRRQRRPSRRSKHSDCVADGHLRTRQEHDFDRPIDGEASW
jgi:hypothetical protein